jgi:hypothetical protein
MLIIDDVIVNKIEKNVISYEVYDERGIDISLGIEPIKNYLNSYFIKEGEKHLVL